MRLKTENTVLKQMRREMEEKGKRFDREVLDFTKLKERKLKEVQQTREHEARKI
jgi:hypothetical protein